MSSGAQVGPAGTELDGTYYVNLRNVAFTTNVTRFPRKSLMYGTFGSNDVERDAATGTFEGRFVWSIAEFAQYWEDMTDKLASKKLY